MQKVLILLVGIFIGNSLFNFGGGSKATDSVTKIKNAISGQFGEEKQPDASVGKDVLDSQAIQSLRQRDGSFRKAKGTNALRVKALNAKDMTPELVDNEISEFFDENEEVSEDYSLGEAYRAEIRQESRDFQKKLIRQ